MAGIDAPSSSDRTSSQPASVSAAIDVSPSRAATAPVAAATPAAAATPGTATAAAAAAAEQTRGRRNLFTDSMRLAQPPLLEPVVNEWSEHATPEGYIYYFNSRTGETSWTKGEQPPPPPAEPAPVSVVAPKPQPGMPMLTQQQVLEHRHVSALPIEHAHRACPSSIEHAGCWFRFGLASRWHCLSGGGCAGRSEQDSCRWQAPPHSWAMEKAISRVRSSIRETCAPQSRCDSKSALNRL